MKTVVILDDEPFILNATDRILESSGFKVYSTLHWFEVPGLVSLHAPDVVLMDYNMPGLNGVECTRAIKNTWPDVKVVFYSAESKKTLEAAVELTGADGYIIKGSYNLCQKVDKIIG